MMNIGIIKKGKEIGYANGRASYIWAACENCGIPRWVQQVKGMPKSSLCGKCAARASAPKRSGESHPQWRGGKKVHHNGYIMLKMRDSPFQSMVMADGYILEHRLIMAQHLGRCLDKTEHVHHKNGIKNDNRIENLEVSMNGEHIKEHNRGYQAGYEQGLNDGRNAQIMKLNAEIKILLEERRYLQ